MKERELEYRLRHCLNRASGQMSESTFMQTLRQARLEQKMKTERKRIGFWRFFLSQIRYVGYRVWIVQLVTLVFAGGVLINLCRDALFLTPKRIAMLMCEAAMLVFLTGVPIIYRTYRFKMQEVEAASRFSLSKILLARLAIVGAGDMVMIGVLAGITSMKTVYSGNDALKYMLVTFLILCCCGVGVLRYAGLQKFPYTCGGMCLAVNGVILYLGRYCSDVYVQTVSLEWLWSFAVLVIVLGYQLRQMLMEPAEEKLI